VADAGRLDFNQDFAGLWPIEIKLDDFKRFFASNATAARVFICPSPSRLWLLRFR